MLSDGRFPIHPGDPLHLEVLLLTSMVHVAAAVEGYKVQAGPTSILAPPLGKEGFLQTVELPAPAELVPGEDVPLAGHRC
jgi:hypothetical protein